MAQRRELRRLN
ncbi:hypothetical protein CGLO_13321 [Colletotrichum gloeosporioides Cg-14]|uniref:Uncharacterized protein n=1 Tax=Colletotrichum gloeosporioides (strain Cg-14) TaxID=1237896 RepID=T0JWT9_COLGC|nr:hypothetical protein CGLO_13321 [Colletotrichum gloeosporioides Cg-14]